MDANTTSQIILIASLVFLGLLPLWVAVAGQIMNRLLPPPSTKYKSHIDKPKRYTTRNGGSYIKPFDVVRSEVGRRVIDRFAAIAKKRLK